MRCLKRVNKSVFTAHGKSETVPWYYMSFNASRINEIKRQESTERLLKTNSMIALQPCKKIRSPATASTVSSYNHYQVMATLKEASLQLNAA